MSEQFLRLLRAVDTVSFGLMFGKSRDGWTGIEPGGDETQVSAVTKVDDAMYTAKVAGPS